MTSTWVFIGIVRLDMVGTRKATVRKLNHSENTDQEWEDENFNI